MDEMLTKKAVKERGFTDKMIRELLPEPKRVPNTLYKKAADICLWEKSVVDNVMRSEKFTEYQEKSKKRREAALKNAQRKREETRQKVEEYLQTISVTVIELEQLRNQTLNDKYEFEWYKAMERGHSEVNWHGEPDEVTLQRWMVNYIRHNLTSYDQNLNFLLGEVFGKVGSPMAYPVFKKAVLQKIAEAYPDLKEECVRQAGD